MQVTIGRIVHYKTFEGFVRPAIVVNVMQSGHVNLQVFMDAEGVRWISSVPFSDRDDFPSGTWRWPPRES